MDTGTISSTDVIERLAAAVDRHDLDAIVACFQPDYLNETPVHPRRGFQGSDQVRRNWGQILGAVPDISCERLRTVEAGAAVWTEWDMHGTRVDGSPHHMRGTTIMDVRDGRIASARFYLEPVDEGGPSIDGAVGEHLGAPSRSEA
jgi:ketosteroid isomerase-like protein